MTHIAAIRQRALKQSEKDQTLRISESDRLGFAVMFEDTITPSLRALGINPAKLDRFQMHTIGGTYAHLEQEAEALENHIRDEVSCEFFTTIRANTRVCL